MLVLLLLLLFFLFPDFLCCVRSLIDTKQSEPVQDKSYTTQGVERSLTKSEQTNPLSIFVIRKPNSNKVKVQIYVKRCHKPSKFQFYLKVAKINAPQNVTFYSKLVQNKT